MDFGFITIVHAVLALLAIIELGLTAYVVSITDFSQIGIDAPSEYSFMVFNSIWSLLVLAYLALTPRFFARAYHSIAALVLLCITALFWFAGSIAMAVKVGTPDHCSAFNSCRTAQAAVAFGFFLWAGFTALAVLEVLSFMRSRGSGGAHADTTHNKSTGPTYPGV